MKLTPRTLLPLFGFALASLTASAQHVEYITQADVNVQIEFGTHIVRPVDSQGFITTIPITSRLGNKDILEQLVKDNVITAPITDWKLVAVRSAPSDVLYVNGAFQLYLLKENTANPALTQRIPYPAGQFISTPTFYSIRKSVERHQGANVFSSSGTVTSYTEMDYTPTLTTEYTSAPVTSGSNRVSTKTVSKYILDSLNTAGYATINYETKTDQPVFYCAISRMTYQALGDFSGTENTTLTTTTTPLAPPGSMPVVGDPVPVGDDPNIPNGGLVKITVSVLGAKLVRQSDYPTVPYFPAPSFP